MLKVAVSRAHAWLSDKYENSYLPPAYYEGSRWHVPVSRDVIEGLTTFFADPDKYRVDDRAVAYTIAFFSPRHRGGGSFYLITFNDKDGHGLEQQRRDSET